MQNPKRLTKSGSDIWIAGVLGDIAEYFGWDAAIVRLLYVILTLGTCFSGLIVYLVLWIIMPKGY